MMTKMEGDKRELHSNLLLRLRFGWDVFKLKSVFPKNANKHVLFDYMERDLRLLQAIPKTERTTEINAEINHLNAIIDKWKIDLGTEPK